MTGEPGGDDLERFVAEQMKDPAFAAAYEDAGVRPRLILALIGLRKAGGLTVEQVAERMEVPAARVVDYERGETDARLSTHQRYARTVGARVVVEVVDAATVGDEGGGETPAD